MTASPPSHTSPAPTAGPSLPTGPSPSASPERRRKGLGAFWRAVRFIHPYRRLMVISIIAALFVGGTTTAGLTLLQPIMRVLLNGDTIPAYIDRTIAASRLGVSLDERHDKSGVAEVVITSISRKGPAAHAHLEAGDIVPDPAEIAKPETTSATIAGHAVTLAARPFFSVPASFVGRHLPANTIAALACLLGALLGLAIFSNFFRFFQEHYSDMVAISAVNDVRRKTYDHLLHVPLSYFGQKGTSDVTSRLVGDAINLQEGFKLLLGQSIQAPIAVAFAFMYAVYLDWRLTLFIVLFAPVNMAIIKKFGKKIRRATRTALEKNSRMLGQLEASLSGVQVVKASLSERFERRRYSRIMGELLEQQRRMSRYEALTTPTMETLTMGVVSLVVLFAAYLILISKTLEVETFFAIMGCLVMMGESLRKMSKLNNLLQRANAAAGRIFEVLDLPVERRRTFAASRDSSAAAAPTSSSAATRLIKLPALRQSITFDHVSFAYPNTVQPALIDVTLEVPVGKSIAIVGRNGSGKTTLLRFLPRLYSPTSGRILIDGVDIATATLPSLRGQISLVTQESIIFPGTIAENIAYGRPLATRPEIEAAARKAFAHEFILGKPQGYDTVMEGPAGQLSGGQRQRLCIARAILRHAPILILDEATSQVDAESEHLIQQAIDALIHDSTAGQRPTTFVIAHRFSTILAADEIIVMDLGRVVAQGTHKALLEDSSTYRQLYERQTLAPSL